MGTGNSFWKLGHVLMAIVGVFLLPISCVSYGTGTPLPDASDTEVPGAIRAHRFSRFEWWARDDSNIRPLLYQSVFFLRPAYTRFAPSSLLSVQHRYFASSKRNLNTKFKGANGTENIGGFR